MPKIMTCINQEVFSIKHHLLIFVCRTQCRPVWYHKYRDIFFFVERTRKTRIFFTGGVGESSHSHSLAKYADHWKMCLSWFYVVPFLMFHHCVIFLCVSSAAISIALLLVLTHFYTYYLLLLNWFLFFLLFLLLSVFFRLLGIRRTILRHLGCFRRNVFNGFDPKLVCNIARPIYSHKRSVKVRKMFTVFFFSDHQRRTAVASQQKRRQKPIVPPIVGVKQEKLLQQTH